jgi:6-phosphogluconolactonase
MDESPPRPPRPRVVVSRGPAELADEAARWVVDSLAGIQGRFALVLSGGETPRRLYETLASDAFAWRIPWANAHVFWGDERFVPADDPLSNFRMASEALLSRVPVPRENIHRAQTESGSPDQVAALYNVELRTFLDGFGRAGAPMAATLLGLGADGHTASLFPGSDALDEVERLVVATHAPDGSPRVTMTYPAFARSLRAAFLVEGAGKAAALRRFAAGDSESPAARLRANGDIFVFADAAAAGQLGGEGAP